MRRRFLPLPYLQDGGGGGSFLVPFSHEGGRGGGSFPALSLWKQEDDEEVSSLPFPSEG